MTATGLAIFASGRGSNAASIISYFSDRSDVDIRLIVSNNAHAGVLDLAKKHAIPSVVIDALAWQSPDFVIDVLVTYQIDRIVLAGFLKLIPVALIEAFPDRIVNIHPALLPDFGGTGMYGHHVHEAVSKRGDTKSGITIHLVNEYYDQGKILYQHTVDILAHEEAGVIAASVLALEHAHYPRIIDRWIG